MKVNVTLIQMSAGAEKEANVARASEMIDEAADGGAQFILLPEVFSFVADASLWKDAAEDIPGPTTECLAALARKHKIHLLAGSMIEKRAGGGCSNTSLLFGPTGDILATYRKMHLFRVELPGGAVFDETDYTVPGDELAVTETPFGSVGMTICYDVRFAELYRALMRLGAEVITAPSAFTAFTGEAHWEVLLRARAIENQLFILAPNQVGTSATGVKFHGHSLIVDPWGTVLAEGSAEAEELVSATIDLTQIAEVRSQLPALEHIRDDLLERFGQL